jgi:Ca2+/Na+ antiporter
MTAFGTAFVLAAEKTPAQEGRDVILVMLLVGLLFLMVIVLGQLSRWLSGRRGRRH